MPYQKVFYDLKIQIFRFWTHKENNSLFIDSKAGPLPVAF